MFSKTKRHSELVFEYIFEPFKVLSPLNMGVPQPSVKMGAHDNLSGLSDVEKTDET